MMEKHFISNSGDLYTGVRIADEDRELSDSEFESEILVREIAAIRSERGKRIDAIRWRIDRHHDEVALGQPFSEPLQPILVYIQALRDVPDQPGFPSQIAWPTEPSEA